jgi:hypothetical protein
MRTPVKIRTANELMRTALNAIQSRRMVPPDFAADQAPAGRSLQPRSRRKAAQQQLGSALA